MTLCPSISKAFRSWSFAGLMFNRPEFLHHILWSKWGSAGGIKRCQQDQSSRRSFVSVGEVLADKTWNRKSLGKKRVSTWASDRVKRVTRYDWVKADFPKTVDRAALAADFPEVLRAQIVAWKKEKRELARANDTLRTASTLFGAELDRKSTRCSRR